MIGQLRAEQKKYDHDLNKSWTMGMYYSLYCKIREILRIIHQKIG